MPKSNWRKQKTASSFSTHFETVRSFEEIEFHHLRNQILEEYTIQKKIRKLLYRNIAFRNKWQ